ncbi:MAG: ribonuclease J [Candidatus Adiutrix sp.]
MQNKQNKLSIIPLGGVGEIGLNCMALEYDNQILVIDAGLMFPDDTMPGVDLVIPDFSYLTERAEQVLGLILTHGHEDHIGASGFLMRDIKAPIYGTRLTLALAQERLKEAHIAPPKTVEIVPRQKVTLGPFDLEFIRVNHSIIDGVAVAINTPVGTIIHTGDFKIDQGAQEDRTDLFTFAQYGERGVLALLSDSTNAETLGYTDSEVEVGQTLKRIFSESPGRVILACFASSLARIRQVIQSAKAANRKVAFDGRGMVNTVKLAKSLGYLDIDDEDQMAVANSAQLPDDQVVIVATGSQGEPMSALARMACGDHRQIQIKKGDTVILSARSIPGHEKAITRLIDLFYRQGAKVAHGHTMKVHASGHGQAEELKTMINLTRPRHLVPIHGEMRQLVRHADLGRSVGLGKNNIWVLENGQRLIFDAEQAYLGDSVPTGRKLVDGNRLGEPEDPVLRNRLRLADGGLVVVTVVICQKSLKLLAPPKVAISGVYYESDIDLSLEAAALIQQVVAEWQEELTSPPPDEEQLAGLIQKQLRQLFRHSISRKPTIWPQIIWI